MNILPKQGSSAQQLREKQFVQKLMNSNAFQRLRKISFLGAIDHYNIHHSKSNTWYFSRSDHVAGVLQLARQLIEQIEFSSEERLLIIAVAICHDMGHSPFSHSTENVYKKINPNLSHKSVLDVVIRSENMGVMDVLIDFGVDHNRVNSVSAGLDATLSWIFHCPINIDTLDGMGRFLLSFRLPPPFDAGKAVASISSLYHEHEILEDSEIKNLDDFWRVKGAFYDEFLARGKYAEYERSYMSLLESRKKFVDAGDYLKMDHELAEEIGLMPNLEESMGSSPPDSDRTPKSTFWIESSIRLRTIYDLYRRYRRRGKKA